MDNITFEQLPQAVSLLIEKVGQLSSRIEDVLKKTTPQQTEHRKPLNLDEVATLLDKSVSTIYAMTSEKRIPYRKRGNRLYFFEDEIMQWIEQGGTSGTGSEEDFNKRLEALRSGKKRKPGSLRTDNKQEAL